MAPGDLTNVQRRQLRDALLQAFPSWNELRRLVADQLDENLAAITAQSSPLEDNIFDLITWARARGHLFDLIVAARNQNPGNPLVEDFASTIGLSSARKIQPGILQKVVDGNATFLDVAKWRAELTRMEWRVCRVDRDGQGSGTAFLVGPDLVLTNYHVVEPLIDKPAEAGRWTCRFDFKLDEAGQVISMGTVVPLATADTVVDSARYSDVDQIPDPKPRSPGPDELDYALLRLSQPVGDLPIAKSENAPVRGFVPMSTAAVDFPSTRVLAILQHPQTLPLKLALGMDERPELSGSDRRIRYKVPTEPGSSGSPVFDSEWRLIALHHSGDPTIANPAYNEAIPIALVAERPKVAAAVKR